MNRDQVQFKLFKEATLISLESPPWRILEGLPLTIWTSREGVWIIRRNDTLENRLWGSRGVVHGGVHCHYFRRFFNFPVHQKFVGETLSHNWFPETMSRGGYIAAVLWFCVAVGFYPPFILAVPIKCVYRSCLADACRCFDSPVPPIARACI